LNINLAAVVMVTKVTSEMTSRKRYAIGLFKRLHIKHRWRSRSDILQSSNMTGTHQLHCIFMSRGCFATFDRQTYTRGFWCLPYASP